MELDKIISDLVEKRWEEEVFNTVSENINKGSFKNDSVKARLENMIIEIIDEILAERKDELKEILKTAIDMSVFKIEPVSFHTSRIEFGLSSWDLKKKYEDKLLEEKKINDNKTE